MKKDENSFKKKDILILFLILIVALAARVLYKINTPLADFHSWRQADTAAVARNFVEDKFDILHPKYDDLSNIQSGRENPNGYRMVEFPLYNALFAYTYKQFPSVPLEVHGRLVTVFFSLIIIGILYYFLLKESGRSAAIIAGGVYAVFPFFVFFSRVVLPETTALSLAMLSILFLYLFSQTKSRIKEVFLYILSFSFFASALLVKPTVIFYVIPLLYLFYKKYGINFLKRVEFYTYFILITAPLIWWRYHISFFQEGVPASEWLITSVNTPEGLQSIFFRPAYFRWIFFERINNLILGGFLTIFLITGFVAKSKKYFLHSFMVAALAYLLIFQGGNVQHEYYQTLILAPIAMFVALGVIFVINNPRLFIAPLATYIVVTVLFAFSFFVSFNRVKDYYNYSKELVSIAKIVRDLTGEDDKIIADRTGDTTLLYLAGRRGAPAVFKDPDELKKDGYKYMVITDSNTLKDVKEDGKYDIVFENDKFALFAL